MAVTFWGQVYLVRQDDADFPARIFFHKQAEDECWKLYLESCSGLEHEIQQEHLELTLVRHRCDYPVSIKADDQIIIRMNVRTVTRTAVQLGFDHLKDSPSGRELVASCERDIVCFELRDGASCRSPLPESLRHALAQEGSESNL